MNTKLKRLIKLKQKYLNKYTELRFQTLQFIEFWYISLLKHLNCLESMHIHNNFWRKQSFPKSFLFKKTPEAERDQRERSGFPLKITSRLKTLKIYFA